MSVYQSDFNKLVAENAEILAENVALRARAERVEQERDRLAGALRDVFALIDERWLVRDISRDGSDGWAMRNLPYVRRLSEARAALAEAEAGK